MRRAGGIKEAGLGEQHKRLLRKFAMSGGVLGSGHFRKGAANVNGARVPTGFGRPWNRSVEGVINFENARSILEPLQAPAIPGWEFVAEDGEQLSWGEIEKNNAGFGQLVEVFETPPGPDFA